MTFSNRSAKWILFVACLIMTFCLVQRNLHRFVSASDSVSYVYQSERDEERLSSTPCELSAKSLQVAEPLLSMVGELLLILLLPVVSYHLSARQGSSGHLFLPSCRWHLLFCTFRE